MMRNMAEEAAKIAVELKADFITGHSLGGIIAEMVCSITGIKGASFAALGAFDPYAKKDIEEYIDTVSDDEINSAREAYNETLYEMGYTENDVMAIVDNTEQIRRDIAAKKGYNGLITETAHNDVEFEVVLNRYDVLALGISTQGFSTQGLWGHDRSGGAACYHVARSCDLRWTHFRGKFFSIIRLATQLYITDLIQCQDGPEDLKALKEM